MRFSVYPLSKMFAECLYGTCAILFYNGKAVAISRDGVCLVPEQTPSTVFMRRFIKAFAMKFTLQGLTPEYRTFTEEQIQSFVQELLQKEPHRTAPVVTEQPQAAQ